MSKPRPQPSRGRIVDLHRAGREPLPAVIVRVHPGDDECVDLTVFTGEETLGAETFGITLVARADVAPRDGEPAAWLWPPFVWVP